MEWLLKFLAWLFNFFVWLSNFLTPHQAAITAIATIVIAASAVITTILTRKLARENELLRKAGTEPEVIAYLEMHPYLWNIFNFVLANVGHGPARNVRFLFEEDEEDFRNHEVRLRNEESRKDISFLPQGESIHLLFGGSIQTLREPRLQPFNVLVEYEDMKGRRHHATYQLDVSQFFGFSTAGHPPEQEIADALKKIEGHLNNVSRTFSGGLGGNRLKVEMMTTAEARQEAKEWRADREQERAAKRPSDHSPESGDST